MRESSDAAASAGPALIVKALMAQPPRLRLIFPKCPLAASGASVRAALARRSRTCLNHLTILTLSSAIRLDRQ